MRSACTAPTTPTTPIGWHMKQWQYYFGLLYLLEIILARFNTLFCYKHVGCVYVCVIDVVQSMTN